MAAAFMTVMIVEGDRAMRHLIKKLIDDLADAFYECGNGERALADYQEYRPDWVLMDIRMEGMDGLTATREIIARFPEAKIAIVTSYNDQSLREAAHRAGACDYVLKDDLHILRGMLSAPR
ncbi:MAG TPA: response regulator [Bryobacteraceae bacterium]